jgi:predicted amidohydrolase
MPANYHRKSQIAGHDIHFMSQGLKLTIAQLDPTIGDIAGNLALMLAAARTAEAAGAGLVIFPELSLTGYPPNDLLHEPDFLARVSASLEELLAATRQTPHLVWIVGAPIRRTGPGKELENSLLAVSDGRLILTYAKQLLPTYNIFDERRYFEPGPDVARVLNVSGTRVGFMICEDGWNDTGRSYDINPFTRMADASPDVIVSINASPSNIGKREQRHELFASAAKRHNLPIVYVNQVGGQDQLVFDGESFIVTPDDGIVFESGRFIESIDTLFFKGGKFSNADGTPPGPVAVPLPTMEFYRRQIILGLRDYARRCGFNNVVV